MLPLCLRRKRVPLRRRGIIQPRIDQQKTGPRRETRLGGVRHVRRKAIWRSRPDAQRALVLRMKRKLRTSLVRLPKLARARRKRARRRRVIPLRSHKNRQLRLRKKALLRRKSASSALIRDRLLGQCCSQPLALFPCKLALGQRSDRSTALAALVLCMHGSAGYR